MKGVEVMLFMVVNNYEPEKRDEIVKRVIEKGTSWVPEGSELLGWWVVPGAGISFALAEIGDINTMERALLPWSDLGKFQIYPVTEVMKILDLIKEVV
jgi:Domain of unknown function (DUF3303)